MMTAGLAVSSRGSRGGVGLRGAAGAAVLLATTAAQAQPMDGNDVIAQAAQLRRFRSGQRLATAGSYVTFAGSALGLAGLLTSAAGYDPTGTYLSYGGSGLWALGFCLEAGGVGRQHSAAERLGWDPGRGLFATGSALGAVGLASAAAGIYVSARPPFADKNDNLVASLSFMAGGLVLVTVARVLYAFDERRLAQAFAGVVRF